MFKLYLYICYVVIWKPCGSQYRHGTIERMIGKIRKMSSELVMDAEMKIESVLHLQHQFDKSTAFQYGHITYQTRNIYKIMLEIYRDTMGIMERQEDALTPEIHVPHIVGMDNLAHEALNLIAMIKLKEAQKANQGVQNPSIQRALNNIRRASEVFTWQRLVDSVDSKYPPEPVTVTERPEGKRKNGVWHFVGSNR